MLEIAAFVALSVAIHDAGIEGSGATQPAPAHAPAKAHRVRTGFKFIEGPACDGEGNLYFVDMSTSSLYRLDTTTDALDLILDKTETGAGLMFDPAGRLFMTQFGGSKVVEVDLAHQKLIPAVASFGDKPFCSVNDLSIDSSGGIYFTDPLYRTPPHPQGMQSVYYASPEIQGKRLVTRVLDDDKQPNGVLLSVDESTLYVVPAGRPALVICTLREPGMIKEKREIPLPGNGDGLAIDAAGNLYIALPGKKIVQQVKADLSLGESWSIPEGPANCEFAGKDLKTLYVTARSSLYAIDLDAKGHRVTKVPARGAVAPPREAATFSDLTDSEIRAQLKAGSVALVFCHGRTEPAQPGAAAPEAAQKLSIVGTAEVQAIAAALKSLGVDANDARSAPSESCKETASLLCGRAVKDDAALDGGNTESVGAFLEVPASGVTVVVATPRALAPHLPVRVRAIDEAGCMLLRRDGEKRSVCVAYLKSADWTRIAAPK